MNKQFNSIIDNSLFLQKGKIIRKYVYGIYLHMYVYMHTYMYVELMKARVTLSKSINSL